jgi:DNA-binding NarL/FixJ family response regulator
MAKTRVIIADEHPAFQEGLRQAINSTDDMEVVASAEYGENAVRQAAEKRPEIAVLSVTLPDMDGIATAKRLKEENPEIGIILVSSYSHGSFIVPALRAGALGYLSKTSPIEELISCIRSVRAGETVVKSQGVGRLLRLMVSESDDESRYVETLHHREMEILGLVAKGMHNRDVATRLGISDHTVHTHLTSIFRKLDVNSRTEAVIQALRRGWLSFDDLA